jgi:hypothetical protein
MTQQGSLSLTDYLIELSHDYAKMLDFWRKLPEQRAQDPRLTEAAANALSTGDLASIQRQVEAENPPPPAPAGEAGAAEPQPAVAVLYVLRPIN